MLQRGQKCDFQQRVSLPVGGIGRKAPKGGWGMIELIHNTERLSPLGGKGILFSRLPCVCSSAPLALLSGGSSFLGQVLLQASEEAGGGGGIRMK